MDPEIKSLLAKNLELTRESHEMLKTIKRITVREHLYRNIYRGIIILTILFSLFFAQKILGGLLNMTGVGPLMEVYGGGSIDGLGNLNLGDVYGGLGDLQNTDQIKDAINGL
ncbi:hypothetical protein H6790_01435 [Candidatus Nomurabacteria bacterium]|nr:hypothetical protein [Candidatus Nomurabacteria bacterium]MCB9820588.1 hypothetical protein [Candidatus Nomurabacteria bacterium]